jgi:integrase
MRRKVLNSLKTMLTFGQRRGLVAQNVALGVRIKVDSREASRGPLRAGVDFPTMAELNSLIEHSTPRRRPFIVTAIFTGMRLGELRGLKWSDVDLDTGVIHVRQRADAWGPSVPQSRKPESAIFLSLPSSSTRSSSGVHIAPRATAISFSRVTGERLSACGTLSRMPGTPCKLSAG